MPLSKAAIAQQKRRQRELEMITSTDFDDEPADQNWNPQDETDQADQDAHLKEQNDIMSYIQNNIADSDDEEACDEELITRTLWPVFTRRDTSTAPIGKRKTSTGEPLNGYKRLSVHPDPNNKKLIRHVPYTTKRSREAVKKTVQKQALGRNTSAMDTFLNQTPAHEPLDPPVEIESKADGDINVASPDSQSKEDTIVKDINSDDEWINETVNKYRTSQTQPQPNEAEAA